MSVTWATVPVVMTLDEAPQPHRLRRLVLHRRRRGAACRDRPRSGVLGVRALQQATIAPSQPPRRIWRCLPDGAQKPGKPWQLAICWRLVRPALTRSSRRSSGMGPQAAGRPGMRSMRSAITTGRLDSRSKVNRPPTRVGIGPFRTPRYARPEGWRPGKDTVRS